MAFKEGPTFPPLADAEGACQEVIEESGPVQYEEEEEEERWGGDVDDMVYDGDPLLNSDYEG